jgi:hypothetical protein
MRPRILSGSSGSFRNWTRKAPGTSRRRRGSVTRNETALRARARCRGRCGHSLSNAGFRGLCSWRFHLRVCRRPPACSYLNGFATRHRRLGAIMVVSPLTHAAKSPASRPSKSVVVKYLSPESGRITTIVLPALVARFATLAATATAAPDEIPDSIPSSRVSLRA